MSSSAHRRGSRSGLPQEQQLQQQWEEAQLLPDLLKQLPRHTLAVEFGKTKKRSATSGLDLGETLDHAQLKRAPILDWPMDSTEPDRLWTLACIDVDARPEDPNEERTTTIAGAATPLRQRLVWMMVDVGGPSMMNTGRVLAGWDPDVDSMQKSGAPTGQHRLVFLVWPQKGHIQRSKLDEHCFDSETNRQVYIASLLAKHPQILADRVWAANFIYGGEPNDAVFEKERQQYELEKSASEMRPHLENSGANHPRPQERQEKLQRSPSPPGTWTDSESLLLFGKGAETAGGGGAIEHMDKTQKAGEFAPEMHGTGVSMKPIGKA